MANKRKHEESSRMIHIRLSEENHKKLRMKAAEMDTSMQDLVESLVKKELEKPSAL